MIDHDRLFKELISTFFLDFLDLFLPNVTTYLEPDSLTFLDKEVFTDVTAGERYEADLLAKVRFRGQESFFLIHVEQQAQAQTDFSQRMFRYFARLYEKFALLCLSSVFIFLRRPSTPRAELSSGCFP